MSTANLFFSLLTIATNVALVVAVGLLVAGRLGKARPTLARARQAALPLAAAVATVSMLGSLYYSEVAGLRPCRLCWYQRGAMYPLAILLLVMLFTKRQWLWRVALPLPVVGAVIAGYHYLIQRNPAAAIEGACDVDLPCTAVELWEFGFISLAYMALSAFLLVAVALWFGVRPLAASPLPARTRGKTGVSRGERDAALAVTATLAVAGVAAALLAPAPAAAPGQDRPRGEVVAPTVEGENLPELPSDGQDPAVGMEVPVIRGTDYNGESVTISKDGAKVIMVVAHWCPACQQEVPVVQEWLTENGFPQGVALYSISTSVQSNAPNYPPEQWFEREGWEVPVIADDPAGSARDAMGVSAFPFFVFVASDGTVAYRQAGGMPAESFATAIEQLQAGLGS